MAKPPKMNLSQFTGVMKAAAKADANVLLDLIDIEAQVRTKFGDLNEFAEGLKANGLDTPIVLLAKDDGRYRLIAGERRVRAGRLLGWADIPARIKRDMTALEIRGMQVRENNDRENLTAYDEAMGVAQDVEEFGVQAAMAIWNRSEGWVSKRVAVKRYAPQVVELLDSGLCNDLEVLLSLNQLIALNDSEYTALVARMRSGVTVSRDDARNKVAAVKTWKKQHDELEKARANPALVPVDDEDNADDREGKGGAAATNTEAAEATAPAAASAKAKPAPAKTKPKAEDKKKAAQGELAGLDKSGDRQLADDRQLASQKLQVARSEINDWGQSNRGMFNSMQENMGTLGYELAQGEWVLWTAFQDMVLPMMEALGPDRAHSYMKKLQGELKGRTPMEVWNELHAAKEGVDQADPVVVVPMPQGWTF